ncbi:MAG: cytidylyltransferase [Candidatus Omnitrophica bacterium]|nr:cytidylyltransferase [Candidatus Omnitrophota bacterium]
MIAALLLGREGSVGFPGKNTHLVLGRPLMAYPLLAALHAQAVDEIYVSTDSERIKQLAREHGTTIIERPPELATKTALGEDAFAHGFRYIRDTLKKPVELMVLLFCNAPTVLADTIDEGVEILRRDPRLDSVVTVSPYNMWSPLRARKLGDDGCLQPFVPLETFGDPATLNCDRDSQGDVYFADMGVSIVRPQCLEQLPHGLLPQRWMGRRIAPLKQWGGCDVDFKWQVPMVEYWLRAHGFSDTQTPYPTAPRRRTTCSTA